ncbi:hypothetical protein ACWF7H_28220 [Peribacillus butanolivorans]|uniref:hypothetical protein n=1 Tax=Peribacillus butanolivorans TaxID=421767 RepID=UPI0036B1CBDC
MVEPNSSRSDLARFLGANNVFKNGISSPKDFYDYAIECSARNEAFKTLQQSIRKDGEICILSDGNKEKFELQPEFYIKELKIVGSSDGYDYRKHSEWYLNSVKETGSLLKKIFESKITKQEICRCFEELSEGRINPLKILIEY